MRAALGCVALVAVLVAECPAAAPPAVRVPVRLPAVSSTVAASAQPRLPEMPVFFQPIAMREFEAFELDPKVELDLGLPQEPRTKVGGWIELGYHSGALGR